MKKKELKRIEDIEKDAELLFQDEMIEIVGGVSELMTRGCGACCWLLAGGGSSSTDDKQSIN